MNSGSKNLFDGFPFLVLDNEHASLSRRFIEQFGGRVLESYPASPLTANRSQIADFSCRVMVAEYDLLVLSTAWGAKQLIDIALTAGERDRVLAAFNDLSIVTASALCQSQLSLLGVEESVMHRPIADWRELLYVLETSFELNNLKVAIDHVPKRTEIVAGLEARGVNVTVLDLYGPRPAKSIVSSADSAAIKSVPARSALLAFQDSDLLHLNHWLITHNSTLDSVVIFWSDECVGELVELLEYSSVKVGSALQETSRWPELADEVARYIW